MRTAWIAAVLLLAACAGGGPLKIDDTQGTEVRLTDADQVQIALRDSDKSRVDRYIKSAFGEHKFGVETGVFWRRAFIGSSSNPSLRVNSAVLKESIDGGGFTMRYTYTADCELSLGERNIPIHAEGTRAAAMFTMSAMRQAVELGVADAAAKASEIINGTPRSVPASQ